MSKKIYVVLENKIDSNRPNITNLLGTKVICACWSHENAMKQLGDPSKLRSIQEVPILDDFSTIAPKVVDSVKPDLDFQDIAPVKPTTTFTIEQSP